MSRKSQPKETDSRCLVARGWGRMGNKEWLLDRYGLSFRDDENALK